MSKFKVFDTMKKQNRLMEVTKTGIKWVDEAYKNVKKNKKSSVTLYIVYIILAVIIILIAAVFAPFGVAFNTAMYEAGEEIILDANESVSNIQNETVRGEIRDIFSDSLGNVQNNITINNAMFQYGWIFVLLLTGLVLFIYTRRLVEFGGGGLA